MQLDRSKRPLSSDEIEFNIPEVTENRINIGLKYFHCIKNDLPILRVSLLVDSGSKFDPSEKKGLSNLLTMCIDEGAGNYNSLQLADEFEMLGAHFSVASDNDISVISLQVLKENFLSAIKLFKSIIIEPHLSEEDFNREKKKLTVKLKQLKIQPDYIAGVSFEYFLFGKDCQYSYPILGYEQSIENILHDDVVNFYKRMFSPLNSTMTVVGDIDSKSIEDILNSEFGDWNKTRGDNQLDIKLIPKTKKLLIVNKPDSVQTEIMIGQLSSKRNENDYYQKQVINLVFGGQFSSRLNLNLREKHGYTYGISSRFSYHKSAGYFYISTSVSKENTYKALSEILLELRNLKNGISSKELEFAKSALVKRFPSNFETYRQISANINSKVIYNLPDDYFETYIQKINSLNLNAVNNIAKRVIKEDDLVTVLVGDSHIINEQIPEEEFGEKILIEFDDIFS